MKPLLAPPILANLATRHGRELYSGIAPRILSLGTKSAAPQWATLCTSLSLNLLGILTQDLLSLHQLEIGQQWTSLLDATVNNENIARLSHGLGALKLSDKDHPRNWIYKVFDYDSFSRCESGWGAKELCRNLSAIICPYCNRDHVAYFPIRNRHHGYRPDLDHFMPRSIHPWFSVSFYNLVPSCQTCNSRIKGEMNFLPSTHMCPSVESIDDAIEFTLDIARSGDENITTFSSVGHHAIDPNWKLLTIRIKARGGSTNWPRAERTITDLDVIARYLSCPDQLLFLLRRIRDYPKTRMTAIAKLMGVDPLNKVAVNNWTMAHLGTTGADKDVHTRPFGKLFNDIFRQIGR